MKRVSMWIVAIITAIVLSGINLFFAELNHDEGWYLYAARLVSHGKLPYVDFAITQGPVLPLIYSLMSPVVDWIGVAGGRLFTAFLGLVCAFVTARLAYSMSPPGLGITSALIAFSLIAVNVYQSYFCTIVKTYALAGVLLVSGFLILHYAVKDSVVIANKNKSAVLLFLAGLLLSLSAGTRLSLGITIPVVFIWLLFNHQIDSSNSFGKRIWLAVWFAGGAFAGLCVVYLPFAIMAPDALWFALVEYHAGREVGGVASLLLYKAGFVSRILRAYPIVAGICVIFWLAKLYGTCNDTSRMRLSDFEWLLWLCGIAISIVHFAASFPYDDYQVAVYPLFVSASAVALIRFIDNEKTALWLSSVVLALCIATSFSSPINQDWFIAGRDRIWWLKRQETSLQKLHRTAKWLRREAKLHKGDMILTQDTYLAVEAGLYVPRGLEMGPFSYFPDWPREKTEKCRVVNKEMLLEIIEKCDAKVSAFSGYGLSIRCPNITPLSENERKMLWNQLLKRYSVVKEIEDFGQASTKLLILVKKDEEKL